MLQAKLGLIPVLCFAAALTLAGCAPAVYPDAGQTNIPATQPGSTSSAPTDAPVPTTTSVPAPPASQTPNPSPSPSAKHEKPASPPPCDSSKLIIFYVPGSNEAGKIHASLDFLNKSGAPCVAYGNPFVWFADSTGNKVGAQSTSLDGPSAQVITLQPNHVATAPLTISDADFIDSCTVVQETSLIVTPAGADNSALVTIPETDACSNGIVTMTVGVEVLQ